MEEEKPKSIKLIGILVAIFSVFVIMSNGLGALVAYKMGMIEDIKNVSQDTTNSGIIPMLFLFKHYIEMCLILVVIGIGCLIGAIFIIKYKVWANILVTSISVLFIILIWTLMIVMSISMGFESDVNLFKYISVFIAIFWSTPLGLLIWFLNRKKIKRHFV